MRFLADENVPYDAVSALRQQGHDVAWVLLEAPGSSDADVLDRATRDRRVIITLDKDFGELAFRSRLPVPCGVILARIPERSSSFMAQVIVAAISARDDWAGHFSVIEEDRIRMKPLG